MKKRLIQASKKPEASKNVTPSRSPSKNPSSPSQSVVAISFTTALCILFMFSMLLYHNTLEGDFVYDDRGAILNNLDIRPNAPFSNLLVHDFWGAPIELRDSHKSYRPITALTFKLNELLHGLHPYGFHLTNVILNGIASVSFIHTCIYIPLACHDEWITHTNTTYSFSRDTQVLCAVVSQHVLQLNEIISILSGAIFASHPVHVEAVANVVGRADVLTFIFICLSLLSYSRGVKKGRPKISCFYYWDWS